MVRGHLTRRGLGLAAGAALIAPAVPARARSVSVLATTRYGMVSGRADGGVSAFKGVPYGADTGPRRFLPPAPPTPWRDPLVAHDHGPASPQRGGEPNQSEDCLRLNVWTPAPDAGRRPVIVYIHGGAYSTGSGSSP